ncbi:MAG: chemotaxis protein CheW [Myxococcota bacterium]
MSSPFAAMLERFFYRPDEEVGAFLELAPESDRAQEVAPEETPEEFLAFVLEGETYAVPIGAVREILKVTDVTEIPRARRNVLGLINVRGEMLPLYDVKVRLRLADTAPVVRTARDVSRTARVVLLKDLEGDAGVLVDRVEGVVKLQLSRLEEAPELGIERNAIAGLGRREGQMYILLDVEQALS